MSQRCGAQRHPIPGRVKGWECDGKNLVVVWLGAAPLPPAVIRADLIGMLDEGARRLMASEGGQPFRGGDHLHIWLPEPSDAEVSVLVAPGVVPDEVVDAFGQEVADWLNGGPSIRQSVADAHRPVGP